MDLADTLRTMIAEHVAERARMRADKPNVTDGHSDGKRVRYVRHETAEQVLAEVLALIEDGADRRAEAVADRVESRRWAEDGAL